MRDGLIAEVGRNLRAPAGVETVDLRGRWIMPGLVDAWAQPAPPLLRELATGGGRETGAGLLGAQDEAAVIWTAFVSALDSVRTGTTTSLMPQSSPGFVRGSLNRLREVVMTVGLRCGLAYRVSDLETGDAAAQALDETRRAAVYGGTEQLRMAVAAGPPGALDKKLLADLGSLSAEHGTPILIDAGTDGAQLSDLAGGLSGTLSKAGLLGERTVVGRAEVLDEATCRTLLDAGATLVATPVDPSVRATESEPGGFGVPVALGSGAGPRGVLGALQARWLAARRAGADLPAENVLAMIRAGHELATRLFGLPVGSLTTGAAADLVILDYRPAIPLNAETLAQHLVCGINAGHVESVLAQGRFVLHRRQFPNIDVRELYRQTQRGALDLWQSWQGTAFPGHDVETALDLEEEPEEEARPAEREVAETDTPEPVAEEQSGESTEVQESAADEPPEEPESETPESESDAGAAETEAGPSEEDLEAEQHVSDDPFGAGVF